MAAIAQLSASLSLTPRSLRSRPTRAAAARAVVRPSRPAVVAAAKPPPQQEEEELTGAETAALLGGAVAVPARTRADARLGGLWTRL